jgi:hypothetical protein
VQLGFAAVVIIDSPKAPTDSDTAKTATAELQQLMPPGLGEAIVTVPVVMVTHSAGQVLKQYLSEDQWQEKSLAQDTATVAPPSARQTRALKLSIALVTEVVKVAEAGVEPSPFSEVPQRDQREIACLVPTQSLNDRKKQNQPLVVTTLPAAASLGKQMFLAAVSIALLH